MKNRNIIVKILLTILTIIYLSACSISPKIQAVQIGDENLDKKELMAELRKLDQAEREINGNKGINGTNVAAALFWLPGLAFTMIDAHEATNLIHERRSHLTNLYNKKALQAKHKYAANARPKKKAA